MNETIQMILLLGLLVAVYIMTRRVHLRREKRAYLAIIDDLRRQGAFDRSSAVDLPYAKASALHFGLRQYRPKALEGLVMNRVVGKTQDDKYYLLRKDVGLRGSP